MADQIFWYLSRSAGLVAWLSGAASMLVGVMIPSRLLGRRPTIPWLTDLHRMFAAMASVFLVIHMVALWFDHYAQFRLGDLLVPGVASIPGLSRLSLALGVVAAWLTAAVELTSLVRERLPPELWRSVHLTSYTVFGLGTIHAVLAGSDIGHPLVAAIGVSSIVAVLLATTVRIRRGRRRRASGDSSPRPGSGAAARSPRTSARQPVPTPSAGFRPELDWDPPSRSGTRPRAADPRSEPWPGG